SSFMMKNDTEAYRIMVEWPHSDNDIDFQGETGNIKLEIVATQVDGENDISTNVETTTEGEKAVDGQPEIGALEFTDTINKKYTFDFNDGDGHSGTVMGN